MKKILILILTLSFLLGLCACGGSEPSLKDVAKDPAASSATPEPTPKPVEPTPEPEPQVEMTRVETDFFTVAYPEDDGWTFEESDVSNYSSGSNLSLFIFGEDGYRDQYISIGASIESPGNYREYLYDYGFDEYALVEENAYDFVEVGGQQFVRWDQEDGCRQVYIGRNESAGMSFLIFVETDGESEKADRVLEGLEFLAEETGNVDGPWYWEGEPCSGETRSVMVGTWNLTAEFIPMEECFITHETFNHDIEVVDGSAYILSGGVLREYAYDGATLRYAADIDLGETFEDIDAARDGTLILAGFCSPVVGWKDGSMTFSCSGPDNFAAAPDGSWGISYFYSSEDCEKYSFADGVMSAEPMPFVELSTVSGVWVDDSYIYVAGTSAETGAHTLFVYDHSGALQKTLTGEDGRLGSITFAARTANGFLALDGNMREVVLWNANGDFIGTADDGDLFGTHYPWFCSADLQPDGSILVIMTEDRADDSAMELVAYRLTGF